MKHDPNSIDATIARIETKLDTVIVDHGKRIEKSEAVISSLVRWQYYVIGAFAVVSVLGKALWEWAKGKI